jgi:hypothetical protein
MKLQIDNNFKKFLEVNANRSIICALLSHGGPEYLNLNDFNWIRKSIVKDDMVSYLPLKKYEQYKNEPGFEPFDGYGRMQVKAGKFVNKILKPNTFTEFKINDVEIEKFVNLLKSDSYKYENCKLEIVEGSDINKYYSENTYFIDDTSNQRGTLWSSCMRHTHMHELFNIYRDSAKMLVLFTPEKTVRGRALLWDAFNPITNVTYKVMDRIYHYDESDTELFLKWANENGYITKSHQDAHNYNLFDVNGVSTPLELQVNLPVGSYEFYPYLDTFKFFCSNLKCVRNFNRLGQTYCLIQTNGTAQESCPSEEEGIDENYTYDYEPSAAYDDELELVEEAPSEPITIQMTLDNLSDMIEI